MTNDFDPDEVIEEALGGDRKRRRSRGDRPGPEAMDPGTPTMCRHADLSVFEWPSYGIDIISDHLREHGSDLTAEMTIRTNIEGPIGWGRLHLASISSRDTFARYLASSRSDINWRRILDRICFSIASEWRKGEPITELADVTIKPVTPFVNPIVPADGPCVLYGDGGAGKSTLALAIGVSAAANVPLTPEIRPSAQAPTMYLDWEASKEEQEERLSGLRRGLKAPSGRIYYRRMARPLADDAVLLRTEIARLQVGFVVIDSWAPAAGVQSEDPAASTIRSMAALRSFGVPSLIVAHVPKAIAGQRNSPVRPYGSVFLWNLARSVWEVRRSDDSVKDLILGLYHQKVNRGRLHLPIALRIEHGEGVIRVQPADIADSGDLFDRSPLRVKIRAVLQSGPKVSKEIAELTDAKISTVQKTLERLRTEGIVEWVTGDGAGGRSKEILWGLRR